MKKEETPIVGTPDGKKEEGNSLPETKKEEMTLKERLSLFFREGKEWKLTPKSFFFSFAWLGLLLLALDFASKWAVQLSLRPGSQGGEFFVIPGFFSIYLTYNQGSAFGIGDSAAWARIVFIIISWVASILIPIFHWHYLRKHDYWVNAVFALCFAGAAGNLIDRTFYWPSTTGFSGVIDFFCFYIYGPDKAPFAIFNVADACLSVGIVLLLLIFLVRFVKEELEKHGKANGK